MRSFKEYQEDHDYVRSVGIITAHNPYGVKQSSANNYDSNRRLLDDLREISTATSSTQGFYAGHQEHAFLATNITRSQLLELAVKYNQQAVIFGFLRENPVSFHFQYINKGVTTNQRIVPIPLLEIKSSQGFLQAIKKGIIKIPEFQPT